LGKTVATPIEVQRRIEALGDRLRLARLRRGISGAQLAEKAGINRDTLSALEHGRPAVTLGVVATVLWALGLDGSLERVADPDADLHGKSLEAARRPRRAGRKIAPKDEYDF